MMRGRSLRARLATIPPTRLVLFLDFDGTVAPIVSRPKQARLTAAVKKALRRLARSVPVVIVSGRALGDLRRRVSAPGVHYIAHHGLLYQGPRTAVRWFGPRTPGRLVARWARALRSSAEGISGALVEDKGLTVAVHDRLVRPMQRPLLRRRALRALAPWLKGKTIALVRGKRVLEVRAAGPWGKGAAVAAVLQETWAKGRVPLYLGDDRTDFEAFRAVKKKRGLAIRVGGGRGLVGEDAWVPGPRAVECLLRWLAKRVEAGERRSREAQSSEKQ
ncbi:MAG: trehalose-phosphatase [Nitrospirae bacterium]|nr:trehalose-phosphatase [Nitrospirota bacterium]